MISFFSLPIVVLCLLWVVFFTLGTYVLGLALVGWFDNNQSTNRKEE